MTAQTPSDGSPLRLNIELKARLKSLDRARHTAARLATDDGEVLLQTDTYFFCSKGRLKLREIADGPAQLVWYDRPDGPNARPSRYRLVTVEDPRDLRRALASALGVRAVVEKRREVYFYHQARIHLDEVTGLGSFIEFEAVLPTGVDSSMGYELVRTLSDAFEISANDVLATSYVDMV